MYERRNECSRPTLEKGQRKRKGSGPERRQREKLTVTASKSGWAQETSSNPKITRVESKPASRPSSFHSLLHPVPPSPSPTPSSTLACSNNFNCRRSLRAPIILPSEHLRKRTRARSALVDNNDTTYRALVVCTLIQPEHIPRSGRLDLLPKLAAQVLRADCLY